MTLKITKERSEDTTIHLESQRVGRQIERLMKRGASLFEALEIVAKEAHERAKHIENRSNHGLREMR